ncbi:WAT1-related protein At1g25270-like [Chenopodium quinoa]|uniref:WAT1-related protein At1g25270-like n=1 Tax=Chenopodium quinoa TaxID=63459 RepID=UPI000B771709|nr:WAT1-related protein At1g25270-like [Chenopodium quinoa]
MHIDFTIKSTMMFNLAITSSGLMMILTTWCIAENSSFFTAMLYPIARIIIAIVSPFMLNEDLHLGSLIGLIVINIGFYLVIWGKKVDSKDTSPQDEDEERALRKHPPNLFRDISSHSECCGWQIGCSTLFMLCNI